VSQAPRKPRTLNPAAPIPKYVPPACAVYVRQSAKPDGDFTSCDVQSETCSAFAKARGYDLLIRIQDKGESGAGLDRPGLQRLLELVRRRLIRAVVVHRLDRLSRRVADCATLLNEFKEAGVRLMVAAMPELSGGAFDGLLLNLLSCFAEFEREMITSRIADTRAGLIARNKRIAGRIPFGYSADPRTKQLVPADKEAAVVREFFRLIEEGVLPSGIAMTAAERGWTTRSGHAWTARQVLDTVSNPVYLGRFRAADGTRPGVHPALITAATFEQCAEIIASRRTGSSGPRQRTVCSVLQGKVRCARCGQLMGIHVNSRGSRRYFSFRCRRVVAGGKPCTGTQVKVFDIQRIVESVFFHPEKNVPLRRGRPSRGLVALRALGPIYRMLTLTAQKRLLEVAVKEVVWNAETGRIRVSFSDTTQLKALRGLPDQIVQAARKEPERERSRPKQDASNLRRGA
jgi:DNA invertase Pin-like site-specific DNA recombinase